MMKIYHLSRSQKLPITQDIAWAFFTNPANLKQLTPAWANMADESVEQSKCIYPGYIQIFRLQLLGLLPCRWVAEISHVDAPHSFVDEQKVGPFAFWHHRHQIIPVEDGVEIQDTVHYALPFGPLGDMIHNLAVRRQLEALFAYRAQMLDEFFGEF